MTAEERAYNYASTQKPTKLQVGEIAKHYNEGYNQALKDITDKVCELVKSYRQDTLEKAADEFYDNCNIAKSSWWDEGILHKMSESKETFIAGAKCQEQQIIKELIDKINESSNM